MRTDIGTEIALDTIFRDPGGHIHGDAPFFVCGGAERHGAVRIFHKGGNRQLIALLRVDGGQNVVNVILDLRTAAGCPGCDSVVDGAGPFLGYPDLIDFLHAPLNGIVVHLDDGLALFGIGLGSRVFHEFHRVFNRNDTGQFEESGL